MEIEKLKKRIDTIAARRMIRESREHFGPRRESNPAWNDVLCDWCGKEYNEPKNRGGSFYCCDECRENAAAAYREHRAVIENKRTARRRRDNKHIERLRNEDFRLLRKMVPMARFETRDVAKAAGISNAGNIVRRWKVGGMVEKAGERLWRGKLVVIWRFKAGHPDVEEARRYVDNKR